MNKQFLSTRVYDVFGKKYTEHIAVGKKFWAFFGSDEKEFKLTNKNWNLITITYIRSGVAFFTLDLNPTEEFHFELGSIMSQQLELYELDPVKELGFSKELSEFLRFNDERTKIINFNNVDNDD